MDASAVADARKDGASPWVGAEQGGAAPLDSAGTLSAQEAAQFQPPDDAPPSCEVEESDSLCVACLRKEACMIAAPCVHECLCGECARAVMRTNPRCPLCRTPIEGFTPRPPAAARRTHAEMLAEQQQRLKQQQELHVTVASSAIVVCCTLYWSACAVFKTHDPYCAYVIVGILCICSNVEHTFLRAVTEEEIKALDEEPAGRNCQKSAQYLWYCQFGSGRTFQNSYQLKATPRRRLSIYLLIYLSRDM